MDAALKKHLENSMGLKVTSSIPVSGGDISIALKIRMDGENYFFKYQKGARGYAMLKAEKEGLEALGGSGTIKTPEIMHLGNIGEDGVLLMEYIEPGVPGEDDMKRFGEQLAQLHAVKAPLFGWRTDNFIGSLPQGNKEMADWAGFYTTQRLSPQFKMAKTKGLLADNDIPGSERLESRLRELCSPAEPCLIHGDLWGGNYLISRTGEPYLIDPSVSYSHPGMDLAMSRLFGGFSSSFYRSYTEASSRPAQNKAETDIFQLYYLLVHLNLFGSSYAASVIHILKRYF